MALPTISAAKTSVTWRVARFFILVWAVQALWVWAARDVLFTPDAWAAWWLDLGADAVRWIDGALTNGGAS